MSATSIVPSVKRRDFLRRAMNRYAETVDHGAIYLDSRGISLDVAQRWRLGVVVDPLPNHDLYAGRLAIPYRTPAGPSGIVFRCTQQHDHKEKNCAKYMAEPGERRGLFNVHALQSDTSVLVLCEGEIDALSVTALAGVPAVGIPGATTWQPHWSYCFDGFDEVVLVADGDDAGKNMAKTVRSALSNLRVVILPNGEDCNSYITAHGVDKFRERIEVDAEV